MHDTVFIAYVEHFSYLAIFIFALFSGYLIPIPEEIILLITGYMARSHLIHITPAIFLVIIAFIIGDNILFKLTLKNSKRISKLVHGVLSLNIVSKRRPFLEEHIGATIFASRFIPFFRFVGPVFSGYIKTKEKTFLLFDTLAIVIYAPFVIWVGYFFNQYFNQIITGIGKAKHIFLIFTLVMAGLLITRMIDRFLNRVNLVK